MAFQFSGTALDVAIQQRAEGAEDDTPGLPESPTQELTEDEPGSDNRPAPETAAPEVVEQVISQPPQPPAAEVEREISPSPPAVSKSQARQRKHPVRDVRLVPNRRTRPAAPEESHPQMQAFVTRWQPFLTETQLGICYYVYNNSIAVGKEYCFTSNPKLMAAASKTERQIKTVLNQLVDWGLLLKGETVFNVPRDNRGTYYKLSIDKE
jgi:hypothetical protein